jgi:uncharacterized protein
MNKLINLIHEDRFRMDLLSVVSSLNLPDWYIAAGFVRNLVWDHLHKFPPTPLNDVDVIYFSRETIDEEKHLNLLYSAHPHIKWQLKNQALMHKRNCDSPYRSSVHAMEHWPEIETAIGVKLEANGKIVVESPFNIASIFHGHITHNKKRAKSVFLNRIEEKKWLELWPNLQVKL